VCCPHLEKWIALEDARFDVDAASIRGRLGLDRVRPPSLLSGLLTEVCQVPHDGLARLGLAGTTLARDEARLVVCSRRGIAHHVVRELCGGVDVRRARVELVERFIHIIV